MQLHFQTDGGNAYVGGNLIQTSDRDLKKDITSLSSSLEKILQLRGVSYYWKDINRGQDIDIGLIAQEVEDIYPELIVISDEHGTKGINYIKLIAPLIESIKEQQNIIENLENRIEDLEKQ